MRIVIDVPPKGVPLSGGCEVPVTCSGHLWSEGCLGKYANERGVYVHHHAGSIKYVGKTETQDMCFGKRLRREFTEGGSGGRHIYPKLTALLTPPAIRTYFFTTEAIRGLVANALKGLGYRVLSASDGVAAMNMAQFHAGEIHMLLSDLVMPDVGGRELAAKLKSTAPDLKVVFISGYAGHAAAGKEPELAKEYFLQKPFAMDVLANTVRGVLDGVLP